MSLDEKLKQGKEGEILQHPILWMLTAASVIPMDYALQAYVIPLFDWIYK